MLGVVWLDQASMVGALQEIRHGNATRNATHESHHWGRARKRVRFGALEPAKPQSRKGCPMKIRLTLFALATVVLLSACTTAPINTAPPPVSTEIKSLLWVGNSFFYYNNSMHNHVGKILGASGVYGQRATSATISGAGLNWHNVEAYLKQGGVASAYIDIYNEVRTNNVDKLFDGVMMMDCSQCPVHPKLQPKFHEYVAKHSATARKHGAAPILFMSWATGREANMTARVAAEYIKAGKQNNALVVPAGLAFANAIAARPDLDLYAPDGRHPSLMGTYLAACTVVASVYKTNPTGSVYTAGLPDDVAAFLQGVAWDTAQAFHAKEGRGGL